MQISIPNNQGNKQQTSSNYTISLPNHRKILHYIVTDKQRVPKLTLLASAISPRSKLSSIQSSVTSTFPSFRAATHTGSSYQNDFTHQIRSPKQTLFRSLQRFKLLHKRARRRSHEYNWHHTWRHLHRLSERARIDTATKTLDLRATSMAVMGDWRAKWEVWREPGIRRRNRTRRGRSERLRRSSQGSNSIRREIAPSPNPNLSEEKGSREREGKRRGIGGEGFWAVPCARRWWGFGREM